MGPPEILGRDGRVPGDAPDAGRPARRPCAVLEGGAGRVRHGRAALGRGAVAEAAAGSSLEPRGPAPVLLGRQHDLGPRRPQPRRGARGPRRRVPHLRQSERPLRRTGGLEPGGPGAVFPRRDRMGRGQGPRAGGLGARIHGRGHRRRRPGHRLRMGPSRDQEQVPGLAGPRIQPQLQLARFDPLRRRLLRPGLPRAVRRPLPRHAHDGHDGRRRRRLQPDRRRPGSEVDRLPQHGRGGRHARDLLGVLPVVHRPDEPAEPESRPLQGAARHQQLVGLPARGGLHGPDDPPGRRREHTSGGDRGRRLRRKRRLLVRDRGGSAGDLRGVLLDRRDRQQRQHRGLLEPRAGDDRRQRPHEAGRVRSGRRRPLERARRGLRELQRHEHGGTPRGRDHGPPALGLPRAHRRSRCDRARC